MIIAAIMAGLLIEVFFQLIKYKDVTNTNRPKIVAEYFSPTHYMSVNQFIASGNRKWIKYFTFRFVPPLVIFVLLAAVLQKYFDVSNAVPFVLLACVISLAPRDFVRLFGRRALISEKIIHTVNAIMLVTIAILIGLLTNFIDFRFLAPSPEGIVDNLWAALFTAMLVAVYIRTSTMTEHGDDSARAIELSNMVLRSYSKISELYYHAIIHMCNVNNTSIPLFYAILIYEDINRPAWLRKAENIIVRFTKKELTVGIAQVKSRKPLTDIESMNKAAVILKNTQDLNQDFEQGIYKSSRFKSAIKRYNNGSQYQDAIATILDDLDVYAHELFIEVEDILAESDVMEKKR